MKKTTIEELYNIYRKFPSVTTDSRNCKPGSLFFALKGENFNGNKFAAKALEAGSEYAVVDEPEFAITERTLLVEDVLTALQDLARMHRDNLKIPVLGITGTNGKTTTKELIKTVLDKKYNVLATEGNLNNHIGVPLTVLKITGKHEIAIIEMGANHPGEIAFLCTISKPDYGLITNVGKAHLEGFGSLEGVYNTKTELYKALYDRKGKIFVYSGNEELIKRSPVKRSEMIIYGDSEDAVLKGKLIKADPFVEFSFSDDSGNHDIASHLVGAYNLPNFLAAACVGRYFGVSSEDIKVALSEYEPSNKRSQFIKTDKNELILDAYNANPGSMSVALKNFVDIKSDNKTLILGDMRELGAESGKEHKNIVEFIIENGFEDVYLIGEEFDNVVKSTGGDIRSFVDITAFREYLGKNKPENRLILIKGSRGISLEKILDLL